MTPPKVGRLSLPAIRVVQPLSAFYAFTMRASDLNQITYSQPAEVMARLENETDDRAGYSIFGTQRGESKKRLDEIASFIQSTEATFPNAIILAANYDEEGNFIRAGDRRRWSVQKEPGGRWTLRVPSLAFRSASIIDGQHRLHGFERLTEDSSHRDMELLCVVFLELPTPYHAYVFATINFNQKKVDRSLAYELFGFDVDERAPKYWSPETVAVYLARLLNTEDGSPLYRAIYPAANSENLFSDDDEPADQSVRVSMATVVDGILKLITAHPKDDRNFLRRKENLSKGRSILEGAEGLPVRRLYLAENDRAIYELVSHFFLAVRETVWSGAGPGSYLFKTVGVQALFDVLRVIVRTRRLSSSEFSVAALTKLLAPCKRLDPKGDKYQASGIGRSDIRSEILQAIDLADEG